MLAREDSRLHRLVDLVPVDVGRVRLRQLETRDAPRYSLGAEDPETLRWAYIADAENTPEAVAARIDGRYRDDSLAGHAVRLAIADAATDTYLGLMSFFDDRGDSVEIGFVLTPDSRGRGIISAALDATAELARRTGYAVLRGRTDVRNTAARHTASAGVLNTRTGLGVTDGSLFQIGSITKLFTTVLVLELVDEGLVGLADPVVEHVPEFRLADPEHTRAVRVIDLLQHRGGFDGDYFTDGGRGTDANRALIAELVTSESFHRPGTEFAYSNAGMVVLGRLVEIARGTDYLSVVRERLYAPLGMGNAVTLPEQAILFGAAVGHTRDAAGAAVPMPTWQLPMSAAATGACLTMSAENLAGFGEMLARGGLARDGTRILSAELAELVGRRAFALPVPSVVGEGMAVGALTYRYDGATAFGHDGQTIGQVAALRILPEAGLVVAVTTNRENTAELTEAVIALALREFADAAPIPEPELPDPPLEADEGFIVGHYANHTMTATVTVADGQARIRLGAHGIDLGSQPAMRAHRIVGQVYRVVAAEHGADLKFLFSESDGDGVADFLWFNRMLRRVVRS